MRLLATLVLPLLSNSPSLSAQVDNHVFLPVIRRSQNLPPTDNWLAYTNFYRDMAGLDPVIEDVTLSQADDLHARYIVKTNTLVHDADATSPWYTPEGLRAAQSSNLTAHNLASASDAWAIESWM